MARLGTQFARISGDYSTYIYGTWEIKSQSQTNNTTTFLLREYFTYTGGTKVSSTSSTFKLNGTTTKSGAYEYAKGDYLLGTKEVTVTHNEDGSFPSTQFSIYAKSFHFDATTVKGTITAEDVPDIPRTSKLYAIVSSGSSCFEPEGVRITVEKGIATFTDTLKWNLGSLEETFINDSLVETIHLYFDEWSYTHNKDALIGQGITPILSKYTVVDLLKEIGNNTTGTITFTTTTSSEGVVLGDSSTTLKANVLSSIFNPSVLVHTTDSLSKTLTGNTNTGINGVSNVTIEIAANKEYEDNSTVTEYYYTYNGSKVATTTNEYSITKVSTNDFKGSLKDSRGFTTNEVSATFTTWLDYFYPYLSKVTASRGEATSTKINISCSGGYWNNNFGATNNTLTLKYRYKLDDGDYSNYITMTPTISGNSFICETSINDIAIDSGIKVEFVVNDRIGTPFALSASESKGTSMFDWGDAYFNFNGEFNVWEKPIPSYEVISEEDGVKNIQLYDSATNKVFPNIYQIGDIFVSSENINPETRFGGTWELIDKQFKSSYASDDDTWFTPTSGTNTRSSNSYTRDAHSVRIRVVTKTSKSLSDTDAELGTIDLEKLGMRSILGTLNAICYVNDDALGIVAITYNTGELLWRGLIGEATSVASDSSITIDAILETTSAYMLDDACDKFYWKKNG